MAEPLKNQFSIQIAHKIADMILDVHSAFNKKSFIRAVSEGYDDLELMARAHHICDRLQEHLPDSYPKSIKILVKSLGPKLNQTDYFGYTPFLYLPHVFFVAKYGLEHFDASMKAQYELTQRFTAEFSVRAYIEKYPEATLEYLLAWTKDKNPHVRRLASEGTRPRLPWAQRLRALQIDPSPVLPILEALKDDPDLYVRRSVANHLNDIGKDNPEILFNISKRWMTDASPEREWIVKHALRSSIKAGHPDALSVLGFNGNKALKLISHQISKTKIALGESQEIYATLKNTSKESQSWVVDLRVHFMKANGTTSPKVFKLKNLRLAGGEIITLNKRIAFKPMTTRTLYAGRHLVDLMINGMALPLGCFELSL